MSPEEKLAARGVIRLPPGKPGVKPEEPIGEPHDDDGNGAWKEKGDAGPRGDNSEDEAVARELRDIAQRLVSAAALAYDPEPTIDWAVPDIILGDNLTLLGGEGGGGKSTLMLQLCVAMQIDGYWLNVPVKQGTALFVTSEDERKDANFILRKILKTEGKSLANCPNLHVLSLADRDACMATAPSRSASLVATPLWRALEITVERLEPRIFILDARADMFGGEENFRRHVRSFIVLLKRLAFRHKLAVILIDHPSLSGINTGTGLSGSTDWHNGPRGRLSLTTPDKKDATADKHKRDLTVKKVQHSDMEGTVFHLRWEDRVLVYKSKDGGASFDRAASAARAETLFLALLQAYSAQGRRVSPNSGKNYAPAVFAADDDAEGVTSTTFAKVMTRLLKANSIHIEKVGSKSKQRDELTLGPAPATAKEEEEGACDGRGQES